MVKSWEDVLGMRVLFCRGPDELWTWQSQELDVQHDPNVRFRSLHAARMACAAMVFAFFVMEEETSEPAPSSISPSSGAGIEGGQSASSPTQGGVGDN